MTILTSVKRRTWRSVAIPLAASLLVAVAAVTNYSVAGAAPPHLVLQRISVSPSTTTITAGTTQVFVATGFYSDGSSAVLNTSKWSSSNAGIANVSNKKVTDGLATGLSHGTAIITASSKGVSGSADLTVLQGSETVTSTGSFALPAGITEVDVTVNGGAGLPSPILGFGGPGGAGASVEARLTLPRSIHSLTVVVGLGGIGGTVDGGGLGGYSAFGSGGQGSYSGGGGGGASGIFLGTPDRTDALVVAGGGGGEVSLNPGQSFGGGGGTLSPGGYGGADVGGAGATGTSPGAGGEAVEIGNPPVLAAAGQAGEGANGGNGGGLSYGPSNSCGEGGGGGGGGYYGGGGGGYCGGGGGGSSFVAPSAVHHVSATLLSAVAAPVADGSVTISWG